VVTGGCDKTEERGEISVVVEIRGICARWLRLARELILPYKTFIASAAFHDWVQLRGSRRFAILRQSVTIEIWQD
jgi:hypothetical protein